MNIFGKGKITEFTKFTTDSLGDILTGDILKKGVLQKHVGLLLLIVFFTFCHIGVRYNCGKKIIEINKAKKELLDVKLEAMTRSSELLGMGKQSRVEAMVAAKDASLRMSQTPPYVIKNK